MSDAEQACPAVPLVCDVAVVGGGPGGATIASLLAQQGRRVVLLEKAHHPRFHIGESLLPANVALFDRLGLREQVEAIGMPKYGVEFCSPDHAHRSYVDFADAWDKSMPYAWQVRRDQLDELLFRHAQAQGATAIEGCRVHEIRFDDPACPAGVVLRARCDDGSARELHARYVVDASGRDTFLANQFDIKRKNPRHNSAALFGHFSGAQRLQGQREGNISIFWFEHGWFWFIPLADGSTSIGAVCWPGYLKRRDKPLREFFDDTIALCPLLQQRLQGATLIDDRVHATGNYSYSATHCTGDRFLMLGDAFAFIDPVFSSGVYLAMYAAFEGADLVATELDRPAQAAAERARYERMMRHGPREFSWFILRITNPVMRHLFMYPQNPMRVKEALLSLLAGDIFGSTPIWGALRKLKLIYGLMSLARLPRTLRVGWRRRQRSRDVGPLKGETLLETR
ncbi:NAD(P)/FAD-dependent oxidoreductase [Aquabacterium sp. OR-4]|uniref:NAD(P)/FAD-dependent oxidoreductase n=1 Tax=Aquabacterium sp. OR-4 TaxID=2978127 RepID=UPI0021B4C920|nr:NAD(P)/FAD-dependent oxidoreductase [Aquabacterium sp. OR-4]MDT7836755.1 NAD(P)/FAD-dependent oxidoreductase [Aquabacterium sp. OR-4]